MSTARLMFAGTLLCVSAVSLAQSQPATPSTSPRATIAGEAKSSAPAAGTDTSGNKSFFESRSNTARTPGEAKTAAPGTDASGKKTFNESRSNNTRTIGDAKAVAPGADSSAKKTFNESRSNNTRAPADAKAVSPTPASSSLAAPAPSAPK